MDGLAIVGVCLLILLTVAVWAWKRRAETHAWRTKALPAAGDAALLQCYSALPESETVGKASGADRLQSAVSASPADWLWQDLPVGIVICDDAGFVLAVNARVHQLLGFSGDALQGRHLNTLFPQFQATRKDVTVEYFAKRASGALFELVARRIDNSSLPVDVSVSNRNGKLILSLSDVSQRKELEKIKAEILSIVSHDLRSPLTSIGANMELLADGKGGALNEDGRRYVESTKREVKRLMRLVHDILEVEKMQSGQFQLEFGEFPLLAIVEAAEEAVQGLAHQQSISILTDGPDIDLTVDGERLVQVLVNLLSNAIKFSEPGTTVSLSAVESSHSIDISVIDSGRGIPEQHMASIFEKFRQVDKDDRKKAGGGTGLGLPICKAIVEQHGGTITVVSEVGKGTAFTIKLPRFQ